MANDRPRTSCSLGACRWNCRSSYVVRPTRNLASDPSGTGTSMTCPVFSTVSGTRG